MKIYIDTDNGTFGQADHLVIAEVTEAQLEDLQDRPDSHIINFGLEHGHAVPS